MKPRGLVQPADDFGPRRTEVREIEGSTGGESRYASGTLPTTGRLRRPTKFTGQREEASLGLYFYNARYYDPSLGRFVQADTIVPNPGDPVAFDRYAYVRNNPIKYIDPSGHLSCRADHVAEGDCTDYKAANISSLPNLVTFSEDPIHPQSWTEAEMAAVEGQAWVYAGAYASTLNDHARRVNALSHETGITADYISSWDAFFMVHGGPVNFIRSSENSGIIGMTHSSNSISIYNTSEGRRNYVVSNSNIIGHELGHAFQFSAGAQTIPEYLSITDSGILKNGYHGFAGGYDWWQFHSSYDDDEIFADMTIGWAHDAWWVGDSKGLAGSREGYMNSTMLYLLLAMASK